MKPFTKLEKIVLIGIFAVLIIVSAPNFALSIKKSRDLTRKDDLVYIAEQLNKYKEENFEFPPTLSPYIKNVPRDPQESKGVKYVYITNSKRYQIYASLEVVKQDEYDSDIEKLKIDCGIRYCNFGRGYSNTPLDKSLEEYENELLELEK